MAAAPRVRAVRTYPGEVSEPRVPASDAPADDRSDEHDGPVDGPDHSPRAVLRHDAFRRLWLVMGLSSFGDWLGLLAITYFATSLVGGTEDIAAAGLAVSVVFILRLAPALLLGPVAGVLADRLDRRWTMVVTDVVRGLLFLSIPLVGTLGWLYTATVLIEVAALFFAPAKDAMVPNLVPRRRLEAANQLNVVATYGSAPLAALVFTLISLLSGMVDNLSGGVSRTLLSEVDLALYLNAATFGVAAVVVARLPLPEAARGPAVRDDVTSTGAVPAARPSLWRQIVEGWAFIARSPVVRGLVVGMVGAFAAGGFVIGLGLVYVAGLGAGAPGYGVLFGAVFVGMALGVWQGPRTLRDMSRRRLFGASIAAAGVVLVVVGLSPELVLSVVAVLLLGFFAGMAWVTGMTLLGGEVDDEVRGRTFAFVQTAVRVVLVSVLAAAPWLATQVVGERTLRVTSELAWTFSGAGLVMALAGLLAVVVGVVAFRQLDDRPGLGLRRELAVALRRGTTDPVESSPTHEGFFLVVEGGDGAGKSTVAAAVRDWLVAELGHEVVLTREPGGTAVGAQVRGLVLDWRDETMGPGPVPRAEALLFAADRAQHVATVVRPALASGAVVVSDRYVDSSVAYQGARGDLAPDEVARLSRWATDGLRADLTVVLDVDPVLARNRLLGRDGPGAADRVESAGEEFHSQVRSTFLGLAAADPRRYLVVDATLPRDDVLDLVVSRLRRVLPLSRAQCEVMAHRLADEERAREERAPALVERAAQEQAERDRLRERVAAHRAAAEQARAAEEARREQERAEEQARQQRYRDEQAAAEAELRRDRARREEEERRTGSTAVLPVVGSAAAAGGAPVDGPAVDEPFESYEQYAPYQGYAPEQGYAAADQPWSDQPDQPWSDQPWSDQPSDQAYAEPGYTDQPWSEQAYAEPGYTEQPWAEQGHPEQGYAEQPWAEPGQDPDTSPMEDFFLETETEPAPGPEPDPVADLDATTPQRIVLPDDTPTGAVRRPRPGRDG